MIFKGLLVFLVSFASIAGTKDFPFLVKDRTEYLAHGLSAILKTKKSTLSNTYSFLRALKRNRCISSIKQLETQCLIESAESSCNNLGGKKYKVCRLYSDAMLATIIEESRIVTRTVKSKIAKNFAGSLGVAIRQEVARHYAIVSMDLMASKYWTCKANQWPCVAKAINGFCSEYTKKRKGSWQGCAGGLIYYIGFNQSREK